MKKIFYIALFLFSALAFSQSKGITYQAVIYIPGGQNIPGVDIVNSPMVNRKICLKFSFIDSSSNLEYEEIVKTTTDEFGMVNLLIGSNDQTGGYASSFDAIAWNTAEKILKVAVDVSTACTTFEEISSGPLASVPFAYASVTADHISGVVSVNHGGTGAITAAGARNNLGLGNIDNTSDANKPISTATQTALNTKENVINKSLDLTLDGASDVKFPSVKAVKTYVDNHVASISANIVDADVTTKGKIQLAGDLSGTAALPTVPGLVLKENTSNKSLNVTTDATSDAKYPSVRAVKTYVDTAITGATIVDADATTKGKIQLTGDLSGTAALPTIAANAITTSKVADNAITDAKITAVSGNKITGNIAGNATNVTGTVAIANGGTGATTAAAARTNLGLGSAATSTVTDFEVPITVSSPLVRTVNSIAIPAATSTVNGYLNATDFNAFSNKIASTEKAANNGVATLGNDGKIPSSQIPAISFQSADVVTSQAAMLAIAGAQVGSIAIRTDANKNYVLSALPATTLSNWLELSTPTAVTSVNGNAGPNVSLTKSDIVLGNVDNTSDINKPISIAMQAALDLKANLASPTFTGTVSGITKSMVGLGNVDNTSDANKPVSTATQTALDLKANATDVISSLALKEDAVNKTIDVAGDGTSDVKFPSAKAVKTYADAKVVDGITDAVTTSAPTQNAVFDALALKANLASPTFTGTVSGIDKTMVGLGNVDNTSDTNKPVSTATQTALDLKANAATVTSALALKEDVANKSTDSSLGSTNPSDVLYPSQKAIKTYVDLQSANAGVADGSITSAKILDGTLVTADLADGSVTPAKLSGIVPIAKGGTNASTVVGAKTNLGLENVDNTSDTNKPVSIATQTALDLKANIAAVTSSLALKEDAANKTIDVSADGTSDVKFPSAKAVKTYTDAKVVDGITDAVTTSAPTQNAVFDALALKANLASPTFTGTVSGINKTMVGLGNVENTALSTWAGSNNLNSVGTITSGTWNGTVIGSDKGGAGTINGLLKADGAGVVSAAVAGTDYQAPLVAGTNFLVPNTAITGATKTKITYDAKGLVTAGADATTADIASSTDKNYVTDAQATVLSNTSGANTGDETVSTIKSKLGITTLSGSNTGDQTISLTGDVTGSGTGSFATTIANNAVTNVKIVNEAITYAKIQNVAADKVLGRVTPGTGVVEEIATTGTGDVVRAASPILVTPNLGAATATSVEFSGSNSGSAILAAPADAGSAIITLPAATGTLVTLDGAETLKNKTLENPILTAPAIGAATASTVSFAGATSGSSTIAAPDAAGATNIILPAVSGTLATLDGVETLTHKTLTTPVLGEATATSINKVTITQPTTGATLTIADGKTLTVSNDATISGSNTGDQTIALTGDVTGTGTGSFATTVGKINGTSLAGLATGILKNTTSTGVPSIAVAADFPTLNQNTTGTAATATTATNIAGGAAGSIPYQTAVATTAMLAKGTDGQVLTLASGLPSWAAPGISSVGPISNTSTANGASVTNGVLYLAPADGSNGGLVTTATQTFSGAKTFNSDIAVNGLTLGKGKSSLSGNTAVGVTALSTNTTGDNNTTVGYGALGNNTTGNENAAFGGMVMNYNKTGNRNSAFGYGSLFANNNGSGAGNDNAAFGRYSGYKNSTGNNNSFIGVEAGTNNESGSNNIMIGFRAGKYFENVSNNLNDGNSGNVLIGVNVRPNYNIDNNEIVIAGYAGAASNGSTENTSGLGSHSTTIGNTSTQQSKIFGALTITPNSAVANADGKSSNIVAQNAGSGGTNSGGSVNINAGSGYSTGFGGNITLTPGSSSTVANKGIVQINGQLKITGGTPGAGKVLTSDANGLASWSSSSGGGVSALANIGSTPNANGATISGSNLNLEPASSSFGGIVTTGTQTFAGAKTFNSDITINGVPFGIGSATAGNNNIAIGGSLPAIGHATSAATDNIGLGTGALNATSLSGTNNIGIGSSSLKSKTSGGYNVAIGTMAMQSSTTGSNNVALGTMALYGNTTTSGNTAIGQAALRLNTGDNNTAVGFGSIYNNTGGSYNVAFGYNSLYSSGSGSNNVALGANSLTSLSDSTKNVAIGHNAGVNVLTDGSNVGSNIMIGYDAGALYGTNASGTFNTTGYNNILIGRDARPLTNGDNNEIVISGYNTTSSLGGTGNGSHSTTIGNGLTQKSQLYGVLTVVPNAAAASTDGNSSTIAAQNAGTGATNTGGSVNITAGNGNSTGLGGNIVLTPGSSTTAANKGTVTVNGKLKIADGTQGAGKVLTSDANGLASWATGSGSGGVSTFVYDDTATYVAGGSIGSGTLTIGVAKANNPGFVSAAAQTFGGVKTFNSGAIFNTDITVNGFTVGRGAGSSTTNAAFGDGVLSKNTTVNGGNSGFGSGALKENTSGGGNTGIGTDAITLNTTGFNNTAVGYKGLAKLYISSNASYNTVLGRSAMANLLGGSSNIAIGYFAGLYAGSGTTSLDYSDQSIFIGHDVRPQSNNQINQIVISGYKGGIAEGQIGLGSHSTLIGNSATQKSQIYGVLTTVPSTAASTGVGESSTIEAQGSSSASAAGSVTLKGGNNTSSGTGGNIVLTPGTSTTAANNGSVIVNGQIKIADGTQAVNRVLVSDANGLAKWANPLPSGQYGTLSPDSSSPTLTPNVNGTTPKTYLNSYITLPPGKWDVSCNILTDVSDGDATSGTWWIRLGFSTSSSTLDTPNTDFPINRLISGRVTAVKTAKYDLVQGHIIINNTTGSAKTYYLWADDCDLNGANSGSTNSLRKFASANFGENLIMALPMY